MTGVPTPEQKARDVGGLGFSTAAVLRLGLSDSAKKDFLGTFNGARTLGLAGHRKNATPRQFVLPHCTRGRGEG